jgi:pimeloyl-ACP methyl ester carboxylesterase
VPPSRDQPGAPAPSPSPSSTALRPLATETVASTDGVTLALHDLGGTGQAVLFCHATGFHGMIWAPVAAELADAAHCWALDLRGHGDSSLPASGSLDWRGMADDALAAADHLGGDRILGVGHSLGGAALLLAEEERHGTWDGLWCYEPIVFPRLDGRAAAVATGLVDPDDPPRPVTNPMARAARRRKAVFPDRETALLNYASKPPLDVFHPAAMEAYVTYGFRDRSDGHVELKCAPETEARTFEANMSHDAFGGLGSVACPVTVAASGDASPPARVAPLVADALPRSRFERFPRLTHFGPMEDPGAIAGSIRTMLASG